MYRRLFVFKSLAVGLVCTLGLLSQVQAQADEVNVYSARKEALILPLLKK